MTTFRLNRARIVAVLLLLSPLAAQAKPIDARALPICDHLNSLMKQPVGKRLISAEKASEYVLLMEIDSGDVRLCALLVIAWATDEKSKAVLDEIAAGRKHPELRGVAAYALMVRSARADSDEVRLSRLSFHLGRSENEFERLFLANRIWVDYGEKGIKTLLAAAQTERGEYAKTDLLYYLSRTNDPSILKDILKVTWDMPGLGSPPEALAFILGSITPGRPKDDMANSCFVLLKEVRSKLQGPAPPK